MLAHEHARVRVVQQRQRSLATVAFTSHFSRADEICFPRPPQQRRVVEVIPVTDDLYRLCSPPGTGLKTLALQISFSCRGSYGCALALPPPRKVTRITHRKINGLLTPTGFAIHAYLRPISWRTLRPPSAPTNAPLRSLPALAAPEACVSGISITHELSTTRGSRATALPSELA